MTHMVETVSRALELGAQGHSAAEVSRLIGVPRGTVRDWFAGRAPRRNHVLDGCPDCGDTHDLQGVPTHYAYLLGMYLGDGCISRHRREVFKLRISLDARYPEIVSACEDAMQELVPRNKVARVNRGTWWEVYAYSKTWPCLFPQHGPGKKHERAIVLTDWQWQSVSRRPDLLLRGLLHSDGCRFQSTGRGGWSHPRYSFVNASPDIRRIFCEACELLGFHWTASGKRTIYVSRKADVALLDLLVGPKR
jgi:hypothetical protein